MFFLSYLSLKYQSTFFIYPPPLVKWLWVFLPCTCWRGAHTRLAVWPVCGYLYTSVGDPGGVSDQRVRISGPRVPVVRTLFPATLLLCQPITTPILNPTVACVLYQCSIAQWAKSGFFVQWVYWVYLLSQNSCPLCAHCAMLQCMSRYNKPPWVALTTTASLTITIKIGAIKYFLSIIQKYL